MYSTKLFDAGWAVIDKDTEKPVFLDDCPQVMMTYEDAFSVADSLNQLDAIKERRTVH
jgi:hypothetical protein